MLLRPRLTGETLVLWGTPLLLLFGGAVYAFRRSRTMRPSLTAQEETAVEAALRERGL